MKHLSGNDSDREFFKANLKRKYRLRLAAEDEIDWFSQNEAAPP
jgi:hypothetical protein